MELVKQEDRSGCGIACVAMIAGKTYSQVRSDYINEVAPITRKTYDDIEAMLNRIGDGLVTSELDKLLLLYDLQITKEMYKARGFICLTKTKIGGHYIVMDTKGEFYDPAGFGELDIRDIFKVGKHRHDPIYGT